MSIAKTPDGGFRVRWRGGAGRHHSRKFAKGERRLAEDFHDEVRRSKRLGHLRRFEAELEGSQKPLGEIVGEWWKAQGPNLQPKTQTLYRWLANSLILPTLGDMPIGSITTREVEQWLASLDTGPVAKRKAAALLSQIFNAARRWGYTRENPVELARRPRAPARPAIRPPTPLDVERARRLLVDADRPGDAHLVSVLYLAGLRPEEARALRWSDWRSRTLLVDSPKTGRSRAVEVCGPLAQDLATWRLATGGAGLIFPNTRGEPISESGWSNWRRRIWYGTEKQPGPGRELGKPYLLRHTCASLLVREGRSVTEVAEQLGHSAEECLRTYAHVLADFDPSDRADRETLVRRARAEVFSEPCTQDVPQEAI
jgi:integrase